MAEVLKGGIQRKTHKRAARQEFEDACLERSLPVLGEEDYDPEEPNLDDPEYQDLEEENVRRAMSANKQTLEIDEDRRMQMFRGASSCGHAAELQGRTQRRRRETVDLNPQPQIPPPFRRSQRGSGFGSSSQPPLLRHGPAVEILSSDPALFPRQEKR
ncbi:hypothetical protein NE237_032957 [Protea cynaroides]|uniref:Uncharacterized protein n=1 Tax=Protea cynaroides TaxID=273540 RepID=A0A9Q0R3K7_9MAGN|nr:hypothetical protein NE237_032957 [Protea cynaroides]